jgi:hypothetical protein
VIQKKIIMPREFTFEIKALKHDGDYLKLHDLKRVEEISRNLEQDPLWGWCIPEVSVTFDIITGIAQLENGSYASEEDFKASPDYEYLQELALRDIQMHIDTMRRLFKRDVEKYYEGRDETSISAVLGDS